MLTRVSDFIRDNTESPGDSSETPIPTIMSAVEYFNADFAGFSDFAAQEDGDWIWSICTWEVNTDVADGVEFPSSLLLGPWTEEMLKHLFWIKKSGASIDWINSTSGEVRLQRHFYYISYTDKQRWLFLDSKLQSPPEMCGRYIS